MHIFIDESGSFSGFSTGSIGVVGALAIPDVFKQRLESRYAKVRRGLPLTNGEVKGRDLGEKQVARVLRPLGRYQGIFEVTVIDIGAHSEAGVLAYRDALADELESRLPRFNQHAQEGVRRSAAQIRRTSAPLFLQAVATFDLLSNMVSHVPTYFAQRYPKDLGAFTWVIDGKDRTKVTEWEKWWSWHAIGALATRSKTAPAPRLVGADYSHFARFDGSDEKGNVATNLTLLMADLRFSPEAEPGLEMVDIVTNAVRRAMIGNLGPEGWSGIPGLMIHRKGHYISLMLLGESKPPESPRYRQVVERFTTGGRNMLTPRFLKMADEGPDA